MAPDQDNDDGIVELPAKAEQVYKAFTETMLGEKDPKMLKKVWAFLQWPEWEKAVQAKLETLQVMGTWELKDAPENRKPISNKWVFV